MRLIHKGPNAQVLNRVQSVIEASQSRAKHRPIYYCYEKFGVTDQQGKTTMEIGLKARLKQRFKRRRNQCESPNTSRKSLEKCTELTTKH